MNNCVSDINNIISSVAELGTLIISLIIIFKPLWQSEKCNFPYLIIIVVVDSSLTFSPQFSFLDSLLTLTIDEQ